MVVSVAVENGASVLLASFDLAGEHLDPNGYLANGLANSVISVIVSPFLVLYYGHKRRTASAS